MLRLAETTATSVAQPSASANSAFRQWPNNRIAVDQQAASNKLLLHLRDEGLSYRLIGKELGISKRSVIKRLKKMNISGPSEFARKQQEQKALEKCLKAEEARLTRMSPERREKYVMLRSEVIRLKTAENAKQSSIAVDLQISEGLVSKILINAGFRSRKVRQKALSQEMHDKIVRMSKRRSRKEIASLLRIEKSTVYKHAPANIYAIQNASRVGTKPTAAINGQKSGVGMPINWAGILPKTNTIASQLRA